MCQGVIVATSGKATLFSSVAADHEIVPFSTSWLHETFTGIFGFRITSMNMQKKYKFFILIDLFEYRFLNAEIGFIGTTITLYKMISSLE